MSPTCVPSISSPSSLRARALEGVKDLLSRTTGGALVAGREHYFSSPEEMFAALGLNPHTTTIIRSSEEFTEDQLQEYFDNRNVDVEVPAWLPRRPLICQTIGDLDQADLESMFSAEGSEIAFWDHFMNVLCVRDARIHPSIEPDAIFRILIYLSRLTRSKSANVGPLSLAEIQRAFESAVGQAPVEEASVMLQRLFSLGRLSAESNDRQFIDTYILDGLRAKDVAALSKIHDDGLTLSLTAQWINPLDDLGQRVLGEDKTTSSGELLALCKKIPVGGNHVLASDILSSLARGPGEAFNCGGYKLDEGQFRRLVLDERGISNAELSDTIIDELVLPAIPPVGLTFARSRAERVVGATSAAGMPFWTRGLIGESFDSVENVARIRRIGLSPSHLILAAILRKTYLQKGSGRKEEALVRGLGKIAAPGLTERIINLLLRENFLERFRGDEGWVYTPVGTMRQRVKKILDELQTSGDPVWHLVAEV
jgi:hypothetical protein